VRGDRPGTPPGAGRAGAGRAGRRGPATIEIRENAAAELCRSRAIRDKYGMDVLSDQEHLESLLAEGRVLLAVMPDGHSFHLDLLGLRLTVYVDDRLGEGLASR
jgi:hypothetical protein